MSDRQERTRMSMGCSAGAALFSTLVFVSMFLTYVTIDLLLVKSNTTGFKLLDYDGAAGKPFLIISMILAVAILAFSILRLIRFPLFNAKLFSVLYALLGMALLIVSIILMITVVKVNVGDSTIEPFERSVGVILHLVFSVFAALLCIGSSVSTDAQ